MKQKSRSSDSLNKKMMLSAILQCTLIYSVAAASLLDQFLELPSSDDTRRYLKDLTARPHMAGTEGDWNTAQYVAQHFTKYGLDTEFDAFKALVSYPVESQLKLVYPVEYTAGLAEDVLDEDYTSDTWFRNHAFNGYAPSGNVTAELVYVNYGRLEDFEYLVKDLGLDLKGKIALARYGKNYRGIKVKNAQNFGMIGCVLYSDPYDDGFVQGKTYPDGPWRPKSAIQRGSVDSGSVCVGDPGFLERDPDICGPVGHETLPKIPVLPISYKDAKHFLAQLKNSKAPKSWIGGLDVQYNVGPGPAIVSLYSNNSFEHKTLWNVIGKIKGQEYPDEYILLGNHRDAWVFGAVDPNSGTACMLDLVRSLSDLLKTGWKPKRTIIFCSWDGEEYDLIGSTHFGENRSRELTEKAVVYLNVDSSVSGRNLSISSSSSLKTFIFDSVKQVSSPENVSLFELWDKTVGTLGSGSDYTVFLDHLGIASMDLTFTGSYGVYHSIYDSFHWMDTVGDPGFKYHRTLTQLWGLVTLQFADLNILPFKYSDCSEYLYEALAGLSDRANALNISLDLSELKHSIDQLSQSSLALESYIQQSPGTSSAALNAQLYRAEREFLDSQGLPGRPWFKHVVQSPGLDQGYGADTFASILDALHDPLSAEHQVSLVSKRILSVSQHLSLAIQ